MPGNLEGKLTLVKYKSEKEKCLEKLNQMQKFIPFLDFMIDKIKKKNNEISLECQLSKFQLLRSMIAEKNGKYTWEAIVKAEDVIEKLITKLDFKDQSGKSKENLSKADGQNCKTSMATSVSIVPSPTTGVSATTTSSSQAPPGDGKSQDLSNSAVGVIMKTLTISVEGSGKKSNDRGKELLSNPLGPNQPLDGSEKPMETDLDKDLDGFNRTDCPNLSETDSNSTPGECVKEVPEKVSSRDDLLSSSREKLMKSLQSRLFPCRTSLHSPQSSAGDRTEKGSESFVSSAFSRISQINFGESKSDLSESGENGGKSKKVSEAPGKTPEKHVPVILKSTKPSGFPEKTRTEPTISSGDGTLKQKLKEKLSTDICEVYRVPGKSVGGSLRSLKESKKNFVVEEVELFRPDKLLEKGLTKHNPISPSTASNQRRDDRRNSTGSGKREGKHSEKSSHKRSSSSSGKGDRSERRADGKCETGRSESKSKNHKSESSQGLDKKCESKSGKIEKKFQDKSFALDKLNDDELLEFVKDNMQSLPHLSTLKPTELRQAVRLSLLSDSRAVDTGAVSEISDDSFQDLDEVRSEGQAESIESKSKTGSESRGSSKEKKETKDVLPSVSMKILPVGFGGVTKNAPNEGAGGEVREEIQDLDEVSLDETLDEEDYALKLIEETTPKTYPCKKKKGLLELPMPITDDLFDDISSIESFEPSSSPDTRDSRVEQRIISSSKSNRFCAQKSASNSSPDVSKIWPSVNRPTIFSKDHDSRTPTGALPDNPKPQRGGRPDPRLAKMLSSHSVQDPNSMPQLNIFPNESSDPACRNLGPYSKPPGNPCFVKDPRRHSYSSSEPRSYAEYKRLKHKVQEKMAQREQFSKENPKSNLPDSSNTSETTRTLSEKEEIDRSGSKKNPGERGPGYKDASKTNHPKSDPKANSSVRTYQARNKISHSKQRRYSDHVDSRSREDSRERRTHFEETLKEEEEEKRHSVDSEELISPLEELYRSEDKPKTGRGYGIQNFRIPKKVREPPPRGSLKSNNSQPPANNPKIEISQGEGDPGKKIAQEKESGDGEISPENVAEVRENEPESGGTTVVQSSVGEDVSGKCLESGANNTKTEVADSKERTKDCSESVVEGADEDDEAGKPPGAVEAKAHSYKTDSLPETSASKNDPEERNPVTERPRKRETQLVECDSSTESSSLNETACGKDASGAGDKNTASGKEEITQEFVEALIRKSFQTGEGKLLLTQVKLFEEIARKLNSKKLKTIQKIINSESGSSSSSFEGSSEDDRRKKKGKKTEPKGRKRKKKGRRGKKHKSSSSSSSSSENEQTSEDEDCDKKEEKTNEKKNESSFGSASPDNADAASTSEEPKSIGKESSLGLKTLGKKRRKNVDLTKHFSGRKAKRKQTQKKLLEQILSESSPQGEASAESSNAADILAKDSEPKRKPRPKAKGKTELDRLHDDIRSMFISAGVLTATGHRMCRILKESGGNMNNLDIVKESAKMVQEEKLKKVQTRSSQRNPRGRSAGASENRSRSQSLDRGPKARDSQHEQDEEEDPKLRLQPRVALQRVDLDNFGYGVKISEDCISFRRMQGRNTAIRGSNGRSGSGSERPWRSSPGYNPARNVFLGRNKRKFIHLKDSKKKKRYIGKRLMDIVKNLPLKMAKMKHLQIYEKKSEGDASKKKKSPPEKLGKKVGTQKNGLAKARMRSSELLHYAFERKRRLYLCKLCSHVTRKITAHYQEVHPEHEVLISRLCPEEAKSAKIESSKNNYGSMGDGEGQSGAPESGKRRAKALRRRPLTYNCRMCCFSKSADINGFAAHVSGHTGEARFQCPAEGCGVQVNSREDVKFHILTKHAKIRFESSSKVIEVYPLTIAEGKLFGFLCSACHFVQICRRNLENHISRQHDSSENVRIIKINMGSKKSVNEKNLKSGTQEAAVESDDDVLKKVDGETDPQSLDVQQPKVTPLEESLEDAEDIEVKNKKRKKMSEEASSETDNGRPEIELLESKKVQSEGNEEVMEIAQEKPEGEQSKSPSEEEDEIDVEEDENSTEDNLGSDVDMEDCVDLKSISALKGSDIISSVENPGAGEFPVVKCPKTIAARGKLKVGPLEALLLGNAEISYECYVKGCLFSTRAYDLFEKHIKISHSKNKWNGVCQTCSARTEIVPNRSNSFRLLTALKHLKLHERERNGKLSAEDLIMELKLLDPSDDSSADDECSDGADDEDTQASEVSEQGQTQLKTGSSEKPFPVKPLLRVRNLLGDRLSTPKTDENDVVALNEEDSNSTASSADSSKMFTIENVRSLTESSAKESEIKIEQVCSLKDLMSKPSPQLGSGKTIIVRSCPTRKIAIRPEPSTLSVDVGHINVVQPPVVGHPVVLSPLSTTAPIRIISAALSPKPKFTVKPIVVSADGVRLTSPNLMPVIRPSLSPNVTTAAVIPVSPTTEVKTVPQKPEENSSGGAETSASVAKPSLEVEVIKSPTRSKSPSTPSAPIHSHAKNSSSDVEEVEEKESTATQRLATSPSTGKKSVKDAKIYQEMLTKTKLCHLFKCMGIECSFTCNNENVFTQHIGLHEAQRRLKRDKGIKTIYLRSANKTTRAFYWQQCAYCCEVVSNTNKALSQHILDEHGHCMYQCAFCFYRAVSHCYVEIHQNLAHSQILKTTPRLIYKCKPLKVPPSQAVALEKHGRKQSVRPYHCDQCGRKFFITHEFTNHLATEHQSVTAYTCHICKNLCFKVNRLINHYKLHSYSTYQCAYCLHGTETEKEMIFHLCNFHFSQPAIMYVRALAEGQSDDEKLKPIKKKKHLSNQLDSLKVIVYESDSPNLDCIVEADPEEDIADNDSESSLDLSSIVAELGIYTDPQSSTGVTPLMKELASIGDKGGKNLTVKTLLPNAQFSSENESGTENCSVLISSGLSIPSDSNNEREMSIPLGQLPLEAVNVQHKEAASPSPAAPNKVGTPDRNLKLNEIIVNLQQKDKTLVASPGEEEKVNQPSGAVLSSAVHKLPPVVLGRGSTLKNAYPSKAVKKKCEEAVASGGSADGDSKTGAAAAAKDPEGKAAAVKDKSQDSPPSDNTEDGKNRTSSADKTTDSVVSGTRDPPLITNVVSLSNKEFDKEDSASTGDDSIIISDVCSLSNTPGEVKKPGATPKVRSILKPPIIRVEDFPIDEDTSSTSLQSNEGSLERKDKTKEGEDETKEEERPSSPDIIILENGKAKDIVMVTLDSDDEKDESGRKEKAKVSKGVSPPVNETIRKEMELLRKQIANETDSLLLDEPVAEKPKNRELTLDIEPRTDEEDASAKTLLSPIEEAICSLNKKLQSETQEAAQKKGEEEKKPEESSSENKVPDRPRTRFGARERRGADGAEKSEGDEGAGKKEEAGKSKKFKEELIGKDLFICGNEKCSFAADDDSALKDHLYVCDLSRESSVLVCPHCSRQIKQFHPYLEHLKYHGEKKFHCGLCSFSSAVDTSVSRHVKQKHKCSVIKILPKESKEGHLLYYPKNYRLDKVDFEVNGYSPGDEDKLPLQSVYQVNVKCAKCPYFTKVRSNMVRHLKIHVKSVETEGVVVVPSTAPTNPVPCLETKERMFDKMTNLAASSQLAQAKEKTAVESLSPEEEAKLPQFVAEQMRYKCCLSDCNYITIDDGMLKHHIKALHDEINYYSCPHCQSTVHVDVRHVTLDKIGFHLKHHDTKLYKCAHCIFFHYQKNVVEKHTVEKHPDRRYFVHTVREPKVDVTSEEEPSSSEGGARVWKCGLCDDFQSLSKSTVMDHLLKSHNTKSKYKCQLCSMKGNNYQAFSSHFSSKHPGEKVSYVKVYYSDKAPSNILESGNSSGADSSNEHFDTTPLWQRGAPRIRHIRGILIEEEEIKTKKSKKASLCESEAETSDAVKVNENAFYCPLCTNKKKPFLTRNEDCFRTHLYQELNYQQFACILCGKMFVDRKDFERHHARIHPDKPQAVKQTKEDHEIKFWVDQVIAKRRKQMEERKRKLSEDAEGGEGQGPPKKKKEV